MITQASIQMSLRDAADNNVFDVVGSGAPTNGTSGTGNGICGPGSTYTDYTNKGKYVNTGTLASPIWSTSNGVGALITASGAIDATVSASYVITKAGVAALTLAAPGSDNIIIDVLSSTAFAHTITATGLLQTGTDKTDVLTFNPYAGASVRLRSYNNKWIVLAAPNGVQYS